MFISALGILKQMKSGFSCWLQFLVCLLGFTGPKDHSVGATWLLNGTSLVTQSQVSTGYGTSGTTRKICLTTVLPLFHLKAHLQRLKSQLCRWSLSLKELCSRFGICNVHNACLGVFLWDTWLYTALLSLKCCWSFFAVQSLTSCKVLTFTCNSVSLVHRILIQAVPILARSCCSWFLL